MKRDNEGVMVNVGQPDHAVTSGWPLANGLIRIDPPPLEVVIEADTSRFVAAVAAMRESVRYGRMLAWFRDNDPSRRRWWQP